MKKKLTITLFFSLLVSTSVCFSQGIYKNNSTESEAGETSTASSPSRLPGPPTGNPGEDPSDPAPIGSGLGVLLALSGGYLLVKKKKSSRK